MGLFARVIRDEAHLVKNQEAQISVAVSWLDPGFYVCLTATPLYITPM